MAGKIQSNTVDAQGAIAAFDCILPAINNPLY